MEIRPTYSLDEIIGMINSDMGCPNLHTMIRPLPLYEPTLAWLKKAYQPLEGSEKQVDWATTIRENLIDNLCFAIIRNAVEHKAFWVRVEQNPNWTPRPSQKEGKFMPFGSEAYKAAGAYARLIASQKTAKFFIDNRDTDFISKMINKARENAFSK